MPSLWDSNLCMFLSIAVLILFIPCSHREAAGMLSLVVLLDLLVWAIHSTSRWMVCLLIAFVHLKTSVFNRK